MLNRANQSLAEYAKHRFPGLFDNKTIDELIPEIIKVRERAKQFGLVNENDIATAVDFSVMYGGNYYTAEWASDVFSLNGMSGAEKMAILRARVGACLGQSPGD